MPIVKDFKVDFFLAGFPKCGTTSLAAYLAEHPNICFSTIKEPFFFCSDFPKRRVIKEWADYRSLFVRAEQTEVLGEGTVCYIYSEAALSNIAAHNPRAKLIVVVRNPVDLIYSLHSNQLRALDENATSMEEAWRLQDSRKNGRRIPRSCREPFFLQYKEVASQGKYLRSALRHFSREQILVLRFKDLRENPLEIFSKVLDFLEIETGFIPTIGVHNPNMAFKQGLSGLAGRGLMYFARSPRLLDLKHRMGVRGLGMEKVVKKQFMTKSERPAVEETFRKELYDEMKEDIDLLRKISFLDLDHWHHSL